MGHNETIYEMIGETINNVLGQSSRNASSALERPPLLPCEIIVQFVQIAAPVRRNAAATILRCLFQFGKQG